MFGRRNKVEVFHPSVLVNGKEEYADEELLSRLYRKDVEVLCPCNRVPMTIVKRGSKYHLRTYPDRKVSHLEGCIFFEGSKVRIREDGKIEIRSKAFFLKGKSEKKESKKKKSSWREGERKNLYTYAGVMERVLAQAYAHAFNLKNYGRDRLRDRLEMPSFEEVERYFYQHLYEISFKGKPLKERFPKDVKLFINLVVDRNGDRYALRTRKGKLLWEDFSSVGGNIGEYEEVSPPYVAVVSYFKKEPRKVYFHPVVYAYTQSPFVPVVSSLERNFAKKLLEEGTPFFKPLDFSPSSLIKSVITNPYARKYSYPYTPDFVVFKNFIEIVELFGYSGERYERLKNKKIELLKSLEFPFRGRWITL